MANYILRRSNIKNPLFDSASDVDYSEFNGRTSDVEYSRFDEWPIECRKSDIRRRALWMSNIRRRPISDQKSNRIFLQTSIQDTAAKYRSAYKSFNLPWEEFCELFTNKFAGTSTILRLRTQLYSTRQQERESVGIFLQKKYLFAKRLRPGDTEEELVSLMDETIKPSIRRVIRAANPTTFTDLVNRAN